MYADGELIFRQLPLRLNLHNDEIEFLKNDSVFDVSKSRGIDRIVINDEVFMLLDDNLDSGVSGFVQRWNNEFPMLLTSMKKIYYSAMKGYADFELNPNRFELVDTHYILTSKDEIIEVTSVKKLIEFLGHSPELTSFAKERKISADDPVELIELLDYYRDLVQIYE